MIQEFLMAFFAIFVIMDIIGNIPIFCVLAGKIKQKQRRKSINKAMSIASILLFLFLFLGEYILRFFGITIHSFRVAGGIIVMIVALQMILGLRFKERRYERYEFAVMPLATPLITGPGVITTVILLVHSVGLWITFLAASLNLLLMWGALHGSDLLFRFFGRQGADIMSRIMGLILAALAVEFITEGVKGLIL